MPRDSSCPSRKELERFVLDQLGVDAAERVQDHLEVCELCPNTISQLEDFGGTLLGIPAGDAAEDNPSDRGHLPSPAENPSASPAPGVSSADMTPPLAIDVSPPHPNTPVDEETWDFLAASDQPECLGSLGPYRVLSVLGRGGMGVVFKAEDPVLKRYIALKVIRPHFSGHREATERFLREARAVASINHDNVISIYQIGEAGVPFLAMPLLEGEPLVDRLRRETQLSIWQVLKIGRQIALGLEAAHQRGVIHRDIKPANIWLERESDRVKLLDFGLARNSDGNSELTATGTVTGTPEYMSPEQANSLKVDSRCDLFSFGCVLYRMLTGRSCFAGPTMLSVLSALANREPPPLREVNPDVPDDLSTLVLKLLEKNPDDRPQTAREVAETLETIEKRVFASDTVRFIADRKTAVSSKPAMAGLVAGGRGWRVWQRGVVGLAVFAAVAVVAVIFSLRTSQGTVTIQTADDNVRVAIKQAGKLVNVVDADDNWTVRLDEGRYQVELRDASDRFRLLGDGMIDVSRDNETLLEVVRKQSSTATAIAENAGPSRLLDRLTLRGLPASTPLVSGKPRVVAVLGDDRLSHWGPVISAAISPDGQVLATGGFDKIIKLWDTKTGRLLHALIGPSGLSHKGTVATLAFSPDGGTLASGGWSSTVALWDVETGRQRREWTPPAHQISLVTFDAANRPTVISSRNGQIGVWDIVSGRQTIGPLEAGIKGAIRCALSADGRSVAAWSQNDQKLVILDTASGKQRFSIADVRVFVGQAFAFTPDGTEFAYLTKTGAVLCDAQSGETTHTFAIGGTMTLAISPNGKRIAAGGALATRVWEIDTGNEVRVLLEPQHHTAVCAIAFGPDSKLLVNASEGSAVELWNLETGKQRIAKPGHAGPVTCLAFSLDGRRMVTGGRDGTAILWDLAKQRPAVTLSGQQRGYLAAIAYSPNGRIVATASALPLYRKIPGEVKLWDAETGKLLRELKGLGGPKQGAAFSPDGRRLVAWSFRSVMVWSVETGSQTLTLFVKEAAVKSITFTPDGRSIVAGCVDGSIRFFDAANGEPTRTFSAHTDEVTAVAFTPDGGQLVSAGLDDRVVIWDAASADKVDEFSGTEGGVVTLAIGPAGKHIAWSSYGGTLRLWKPGADGPRTLVQISEGGRHVSNVGFYQVAFSPDGRDLATANGNGTAFIFRVVDHPSSPSAVVSPRHSPRRETARPNRALEFDGKHDYVDLGDVAYDPQRPFTFEATILARNLPDRGGGTMVVGYGGTMLVMADNHLRFQTSIGGAAPAARSKSFPAERRWIHMAGVFDGKQLRLYIDGKRQTDSSAITSTNDPSRNNNYRIHLTIGGSGDRMTFHGLIDEVRISQVARYTKNYTPKHRFDSDEKTIALYHFDAGQGGTLIDSSGHGHNARIVGAKWVNADGSAISQPLEESTHER